MLIEFTVEGEARPAGSKTTYPVLDQSGEIVRTKKGRLLTRAKHANPKTAVWMDRVASKAREVYQGPLLDSALSLGLLFVRSRPQSHFGTGRNAGILKQSAPKYPMRQPDTIKLTRAIEDALTKVIWTDDSRIVDHILSKRWGTHYYVEVTIETLSETE